MGHEFPLTSADAVGEAIVLLWQNGHFIAPLPHYADPNAQRSFTAIMFNDASSVRQALAAGMKTTAKDRQGITLLQYAAEAGSEACVDILLAAHASANSQAAGTPLSRAVGKGRTATVERLLAARADPNRTINGTPILSTAIDHGFETIALRLVKAGANVDAVDTYNQPPLAAALNAGSRSRQDARPT